jgi:hypothetical protein
MGAKSDNCYHLTCQQQNMRKSSNNSAQKKDCKVCRQIRQFLILAGALLVLIWAQPGWRLPPGFDYTTLVGDLFLWSFLALFAFKAWLYYKDKDR